MTPGQVSVSSLRYCPFFHLERNCLAEIPSTRRARESTTAENSPLLTHFIPLVFFFLVGEGIRFSVNRYGVRYRPTLSDASILCEWVYRVYTIFGDFHSRWTRLPTGLNRGSMNFRSLARLELRTEEPPDADPAFADGSHSPLFTRHCFPVFFSTYA
jgi:hypothetical protein